MNQMFASMWFFLSCALVNVLMTSAKQVTPVIEVQSGRLRGFVETLTTKAKIRKYLGIPFARANRFELPVDPLNWTDVKNMTSHGKVCYQETSNRLLNYTYDDMSEDCLNLNIYVPDKQTVPQIAKLPVMVWIHGGSYLSNSNRISDGSYLATIGEVIVVTINYRLGLLGLLPAKQYGFIGNYAMYDQLASLKWVKKNIEKFGGDPDQVTIFGNSIGGESVSLHCLSALSKGLFKYAIMQSGVSINSLGYTTYKSKEKARKFFMERLNCAGSIAQVRQCLKSLPAKDFGIYEPDYVLPVLDGKFLPDKPENLVKTQPLNPQSIITGVANDDGSCVTDAIPALSRGHKIFENKMNSKKKLQDILAQANYISRFVPNNPLYLEAVTCKYTTNKTDFRNADSNRRIILDIMTDAFFLTPAVVHAKDYVKRGVKTFFYFVTYGVPMPKLFKVPNLVEGYHETDKFMAFGFPLKEKDRLCSYGSQLSVQMMKMWSNFAKTGDPNIPNRLKQNIQWPQYDLTSKKYLVIKPVMEVKSDLRPDAVKFWEKDMQSLNTTISKICKTAGVARKPIVMPSKNMMKNPPQGRF